MRVFIADTRSRSTGVSPEDRHREELIELLALSQPNWEFMIHTPRSGIQNLVEDPRQIEPWKLEGLEVITSLQCQLPRRAYQVGADVILSLYGGSPLRSPVPVLSYLADLEQVGTRSLIHRLAFAAGRAGVESSAARLAYRDGSPSRIGDSTTVRLDPWVSMRFHASMGSSDQMALDSLGLKSGYVLAFGFTLNDLPFLMAAWSWVISSTGESIPMVVLGLGEDEMIALQEHARAMDLEKTITSLRTPGLDTLAVVYRQADLFIYGGRHSSGQALRWALASGLPIAAQDVPITTSILADAAYLTPEGDTRLLGAAMLSLLVEENLATRLREKALSRAEGFHRVRPLTDLQQSLQAQA